MNLVFVTPIDENGKPFKDDDQNTITGFVNENLVMVISEAQRGSGIRRSNRRRSNRRRIINNLH